MSVLTRCHRLNIFYLLLEKLNSFAENAKIDVSIAHDQIVPDYEEKRTNAYAEIEELNITKRMVSTCMYINTMCGTGFH